MLIEGTNNSDTLNGPTSDDVIKNNAGQEACDL